MPPFPVKTAGTQNTRKRRRYEGKSGDGAAKEAGFRKPALHGTALTTADFAEWRDWRQVRVVISRRGHDISCPYMRKKKKDAALPGKNHRDAKYAKGTALRRKERGCGPLRPLGFARDKKRTLQLPYKFLAWLTKQGIEGKFCGNRARALTRAANMKTKLSIVLVGLMASASLVSAQQRTSLELNKPYYCSNGLTVTVMKCVLQNGKEFCEFKVEQNGKLAFQAAQTGEQLAAGVKSCSTTPPKAGAPGATAPVPAAAKTVQPVNGKPFSPSYLNGMPSVDFVKSEIQGKDATDTLARQVAVFNELPTVITRFQLADRKRYDATPDEEKVTGLYQLAAYELEQGYKKTHTAAEAQAFTQLHGRYELDSALNREMHVKLFSSAFLLELGGADKARNQWYQAHIEQEKRESEQARAQAAGTKGGSPFIRNDPGTLAARRCVELGGNELECVGKGLWGGLMDMAGLPADTTLSGMGSGPSRSGVAMNGQYNGSSGVWINFAKDSVTVSGCGKLVPESLSYTLTKKPNQLLINVKNEPSPFVFSMESDKKLVGPGPIDIKGRIIIGYNNVWMQEYRNGVPQAGGSCAGNCGYWVHDPIYAPKTERCAIGAFAQAPPEAPDKSALINSLTSAITTVMHTGPAGLRMAGKYTNSGGLVLEFEDDGVTIDCGAAHVKQTYNVENAAAQIEITVKNGAAPFTLAVQQNGTLSGSGNADVAGRVVTGATGDALTYAARNARCAIGTLTSK